MITAAVVAAVVVVIVDAVVVVAVAVAVVVAVAVTGPPTIQTYSNSHDSQYVKRPALSGKCK